MDRSDNFRSPQGEPGDGYCKCRSVLALWAHPDAEFPFVRQGAMHSPAGCLRRELDISQLKSLYFDLTGFRLGTEIQSLQVVFQAVMNRLEQDPEAKAAVYRGTLPRSTYYNVAGGPVTPGSSPGRGVGGVPKIPPPSDLPIKPPWES